jgi:regulator of replication initiation timing
MPELIDYINIPTWGALAIVVVQIIVGAFIIRFSKYMGKKGEYRAMKEEIGKITATVEGVKQDNAKDLENIKGEISVLAIRKNIYYQDERNSIVGFYNAFNKLLFEGLVFELEGIEAKQISILEKQLVLMKEQHTKLSIAHSKFMFFIDEDKGKELIEIASIAVKNITALYKEEFELCREYGGDILANANIIACNNQIHITGKPLQELRKLDGYLLKFQNIQDFEIPKVTPMRNTYLKLAKEYLKIEE